MKPPVRIKVVTIPGVGDFHIRVMSGTMREAYSRHIQGQLGEDGDTSKIRGANPSLLAAMLCNPDGSMAFPDFDAGRKEIGDNWDYDVIDKIAAEAFEWNKSRTSDVLEIAKNSEAIPSE
jgi:hypothetical protein